MPLPAMPETLYLLVRPAWLEKCTLEPRAGVLKNAVLGDTVLRSRMDTRQTLND